MSSILLPVAKPESAPEEHARRVAYIRSLDHPESKVYKRLHRHERTEWVTPEAMRAIVTMATMDIGIGRIPGMDTALITYLVEDKYLHRCARRGFRWIRGNGVKQEARPPSKSCHS